MFGNRSLRFKLMSGGAVIALGALLVVGLYSFFSVSSSLEEIASAQSEQNAKSLANMVQMVLLEELKIAGELSARETFADVAAKVSAGNATSAAEEIEKAHQELSAIHKKIGGDYSSIFLVDTGGVCFTDHDGRIIGTKTGDRDYFNAAKAGKINVGNVVISRVSGKPYMPIAGPLYSKTGEFVGAVIIGVNIEFLCEKITSLKLGKTGYAFMINQQGFPIAHPNQELVLKMNFTEQTGTKEFAGKMIKQQTGSIGYNFQGAEKIAGFAPVELTKWSVGVTQNKDELMAAAFKIRNLLLILGVIFLAASSISIYFFSRSITKPIERVIVGLSDTSSQVTSASAQVAGASQSLAEGTSEQASAIEETSASLEEMTSMTKRNADNSAQAKVLMAETRNVVSRVDGHVNNMTLAIEEVMRTSEETGKIIKTIDEIAFQTNLLALNAAVEAARAGEAGAGFAVVADEVRNLAMRAAEAAKSTSSLIENTIATVRKSHELTKQTQEAFKENVSIAGKIGEIVDEIAVASGEQAQGIEQISKAVAEMDKVVQDTAASAEESAGAAGEMGGQAQRMQDYVGELTTVVGGTGSHGDLGSQGHVAAESITGETSPLPVSVNRGSEKKNALPREKAFISAKPIKRRPEKLIPLEEESFQNF